MASRPSARRRAPPRTSSSTSRGCARHWPPTIAGRASSPTVAATSSRWPRRRSTRLRFEHLVEEAAREPAGAGANGAASAALELWHGAPLADVAAEPFAAAEIGRLEELHLRAIELADRRRARRRAPRRGDRPARGADRRGAARRALSRPANARPLSRRAPVRGARGLPRGPPDADRADRGRARARAAPAPGADPRPGPRPRRAGADRTSCRASSRAARRCSPGASASLAGCAGAGSRRAKDGSSAPSSGGPPGSARHGSSPSSRPRSRAPGRRSSTPAAASSPTPPWRPSPRPGRATDRRCWCSTTPTTRRRRCSRPPPALAREPEDRPLLICVLQHDEQGPPAFAGLLERRRRPAPAARSAGRGRDRRDRRALRPRRGRRDAAARR